jgi:glucose dehydrogenase
LPDAGYATGANDGQWPMAAKDLANTRYTALDQITPANAAQLAVAWRYTRTARVLRDARRSPRTQKGGRRYVFALPGAAGTK